MKAFVVITAHQRNTVVAVGALSTDTLNLAILAILSAALVSAYGNADTPGVTTSKTVFNSALLSRRAHVIRINILAISISGASFREGVAKVIAVVLIIIIATAEVSTIAISSSSSSQGILERLSGFDIVDLLIAREDITDISSLNSDGIFGGTTSGLLLLNGVLIESNTLTDNDVTLDVEVTELAARSAAFAVSLLVGAHS